MEADTSDFQFGVWVGLDNYQTLFADPVFAMALRNSIYWMVVEVAVVVVGRPVASRCSSTTRWAAGAVFRVILLVPWALAPVANAVLWKWIYNSSYGVLNYVGITLGVIPEPVVWLGDPATALNALLVAEIWKEIPFITLLLLAGLQNVPRILYRASKLDGAGPWQTFRFVTLPQMRTTILICIVLQSIWALKSFDLVYVLTRGGPANATTMLNFLAYRVSFQFGNLGLGAAVADILFVMMFMLALAYLRVFQPARAARARRGVSRRTRARLRRIGVALGLALFVAWTLAPITWAVISSLLPLSALITTPPDLSPGNFTLENYVAVLSADRNLLAGLRNSAIVASFTAVLALLIGSVAAYALARLHVPGANRILMLILVTQMFPGMVIIIPLFIALSRIGLTDSYIGLIVVYLSFVLPIVIWVLKGFFEAVPRELERAAAVDGASTLQTYRLVVLPISLPPLFAVGVFAFIEAWNEFFFAVILTQSNAKTAPVVVAEFSGQYVSLYGQMVAAAVIASIPVVVLAIVFRRYILEGFVEGAVKG